MMHRCKGGSHGNMVGPCSCGYFHGQSNSSSFSMPNHNPFDETTTYDMYSFASSSSSSPSPSYSPSSVDCTLSLGTASTRLTNNGVENPRRSSSSCMSNFSWDILQSKQPSHKSSRRNNHATANSSGGEGLLSRRCANCDTTSTPLWRNGPKGPKSLCNACGIRFKKEERRASAAAATNGNASATIELDAHQHMLNSAWVHHHHQHSPAAQKIPYFSSAFGKHEFRFMEDDEPNSDTGIHFLSWRLNVTDRPGLVHDFTR